ncbi:hypothetical protein BHE74_00001545 [Ensete ventricosum]|nr:hypothetical protein GW17_00028065 [Ensete ventricosum]RWW89502.1 hypothetical protein BHE74_00001545 [Ensete ventricosum]RZR76019.1 hypothetical protein BHM03_00000623 [Ensete ventricosum]
MAKKDEATVMEVDGDKSAAGEQIIPKFSINGLHSFGHWGACFVISVLQLVKSAQMQHGLRHRDYTRYRCVLCRCT